MPSGTSPVLRRRDALIATCWVPRIYTTDPPRLVPHTEWRLDVRLVCATTIRAVLLLSDGLTTAWSLHPSRPQQEIATDASFRPHDWGTSSRVRIHFGGEVEVEDDLLMRDPRTEVTVVAPERATTGSLVSLAHVTKHPVTLAVLMLDVFDCEERRMDRWRVRPDLRDALPPFLAEATGGRQHGTGHGPPFENS